MPRNMKAEDWQALRFDVGNYFTPSAPVGVAELFAGRKKQLDALFRAISEQGRHAIIYGEPGVGKTSIAMVLKYIIQTKVSRIQYFRKAAFSTDTFSTIWLDLFRNMKFSTNEGAATQEYAVSDLYKDGVTPSDVIRELSMFSLNDIPIIVIDEYNLIRDKETSRLMAETVKALSDTPSMRATVIIVGISDSVSELVGGHTSIVRCTEEVLMPRMEGKEIRLVLEERINKLGMTISGDAKWKIINLSKGLPAFTHALGREAVLSAIEGKRLSITEADVDVAIDGVLNSSQHTLKDDYELATHSNQKKARHKQIITACAMAQSDEIGYFTPKDVEEPASAILGQEMGIDDFNAKLKEFTEEKRGSILQRKGGARMYRYRFRNPAMQPFAIMKGIKAGFLDEDAKLALSSPEQLGLFPSGLVPPS